MLFFKRLFHPFKVVAIIAIRNEELYIQRCLEHLIAQGIDVFIIDNESTDNSVLLSKVYLGRGLLGIENHHYPGYKDWKRLLEHKTKIAQTLDADWIIHCDADEILESPFQNVSLKEAIRNTSKKGYNAINFDEFVFIPTDSDESFKNDDYVPKMNYYYFFEPSPQRLIRAWKNNGRKVDLASSGGHRIKFKNRKVYHRSFILRHYITLSKDMAINKYTNLKYAPDEVKKGWHNNRIGLNPENFSLPLRTELKKYTRDGKWDKSDPWQRHFFNKGGIS